MLGRRKQPPHPHVCAHTQASGPQAILSSHNVHFEDCSRLTSKHFPTRLWHIVGVQGYFCSYCSKGKGYRLESPTRQSKGANACVHRQFMKGTRNDKIHSDFCYRVFQVDQKNRVSMAFGLPKLGLWLHSFWSMLFQSCQVPAATQDFGWHYHPFLQIKKPSSSRPKNTPPPWSAALFSSTPVHWTSCLTRTSQKCKEATAVLRELIHIWVSLQVQIPEIAKIFPCSAMRIPSPAPTHASFFLLELSVCWLVFEGRGWF